jgi:hypothetical protein
MDDRDLLGWLESSEKEVLLSWGRHRLAQEKISSLWASNWGNHEPGSCLVNSIIKIIRVL